MESRTLLPLDQVVWGDCIQVLSSFPEESVDLVFADPPYNLQLRQELWRPNSTKVDAVDDAWDKFPDLQAYDHFSRQWLTACRRVLKRTGTIWVIGSYHNIYRLGAMLQDLGFWILNDVVWIKTNPMPNFRGVRFTNAHETLIWAQKERGAKYTFNHHAMKSLNGDLQMRSDWYLPLCSPAERVRRNGKKAHSTQKPEALLYRVVLSSSNPGDIVLDPFFGTGTTGAVCKKLHRHWIGIEKEAEYVDLAQERIEAISGGEENPQLLQIEEPRRRPRVSFGALLEQGLIKPGQELVYKDGSIAVVTGDGRLRCGLLSGSIHQVASDLSQAPCNGWDLWYYRDPETGEQYPIARLRDLFREMFL